MCVSFLVIVIVYGCIMVLKVEGVVFDCFEVMLKCEEGEDEEEVMVVVVILWFELMFRVI